MKNIVRFITCLVWSLILILSSCLSSVVYNTDMMTNSETLKKTEEIPSTMQSDVKIVVTTTSGEQQINEEITTFYRTPTRVIIPSKKYVTVEYQQTDQILKSTPIIKQESTVLTETNRIRIYDAQVLPSESCIDLDTGKVTGIEDAKADIKFFEDGGSIPFFYIITINDSKAEIYQYQSLTYQQCLDRKDGFIENKTINGYYGSICVLTNEGRLSLLKFNTEGRDDIGDWVEFNLVTWSEIIELR